MMNSPPEMAQNHSVAGYMQRLSTKELFCLLRRYLENETNPIVQAEEIIAVLERRFDGTQK